MTREEGIRLRRARVFRRFGRLDVWVKQCGMTCHAPMDQVSLAFWRVYNDSNYLYEVISRKRKQYIDNFNVCIINNFLASQESVF